MTLAEIVSGLRTALDNPLLAASILARNPHAYDAAVALLAALREEAANA